MMAAEGKQHESSAENGSGETPLGETPLLLDQVEEFKTLGGECYKAGQVEEALVHYSKALRLLDAAEEDGFKDSKLRAALCSNQALCYLKLEHFGQAEQRAAAALAAEPSNAKASYRRGLARLRLGDLVGACEDLQRASRLEPQNREVRERLEEAQLLLHTTVPADQKKQVAVATAAASALSDLYSEKPDLNEGRLVETHREQREWISTIPEWKEIQDISFADEESKISVYMTLPRLHELPPNKICVWMHATSLEVRVIDLDGTNWCYVAQELWAQIDPKASSYKVKRDKLALKLLKKASARSWDRWEKLRRI